MRRVDQGADTDLVRQWRVEGFYQNVDCKGQRYWNPDWGPRPPEDNLARVAGRVMSMPSRDPRPVPPASLPYKD